jgi:hypothetical protein
MAAEKRELTTAEKFVKVALALILIGFPCYLFIKWISAPTKPTTTFDSSVTLEQPANPATAVVEILVRNTGKIASAPECMVQLHDESDTYQGSDTFTPDKTLQPGEQWSFRGDVTVTKEGAAYITQGGVTCL